MRSITVFLRYLAAFLAGAAVVAVPGYILGLFFMISTPLGEMSLVKGEIVMLKGTGQHLEPQFAKMRKRHCLFLRGSLENLQALNQSQLPSYRFENYDYMKQSAEETLRLLKDTSYCEPADYQQYLDNMKMLELTPL
ncbi:hypothetical protein [Rheinheimera sp. F8]|uniref:hypothetical protein n=1 Tax=Rheinheimera sp. F8 TaxID=1763998 RepID=UPI0007448D7F|nr:hypothetical protein [Rheinheimera sp. F8]ALZ75128.1 hypothetical protein ATY27_04735 [Rheinheimera sp. F8]ALZ76447.1 hypothetical protein ATY27_12210 [Rheinheimera sp. F8]